MIENKKALLNRESENNHTFIIPHNINNELLLNTIPSILKDTVLLLSKKHVDTPINCILNVLIVKLAQMITSKRVQYKNINETGFPNWYSIVFMDSGIGKDYLVKDLDRLIFKNFGLWFDNRVERYKLQAEKQIEEKANKEYKTPKEEKIKRAFIQTEKAKIRNIFKEVSAGTKEGFYSDAEALSIANFGSVFLKISELGNYLNNLNTESRAFFECLFDAYDGTVKCKSLKGENRKSDLNNIPTNTLLYSDPNLFKGELKNIFKNLMLTGIGRRAMVSFRKNAPLIINEITSQEIKDIEKKLTELGEILNKIFFNISDCSIYELDDIAINNFLNKYKNACKEKFNILDDEIAKREVNSRFYKALKLSCLYACLNHPTQLKITPVDLQQAIITIEALGKDLEEFTNYKPKQNDKYDNLFMYFKNHIGEKIKKTELTTKVFKSVDGLSRADIRENFIAIMACVDEIAQSNGYFLVNERGDKNSQSYYLMPMQNKKNELEEILNKS